MSNEIRKFNVTDIFFEEHKHIEQTYIKVYFYGSFDLCVTCNQKNIIIIKAKEFQKLAKKCEYKDCEIEAEVIDNMYESKHKFPIIYYKLLSMRAGNNIITLPIDTSNLK